jgi:hypothetical protein
LNSQQRFSFFFLFLDVVIDLTEENKTDPTTRNSYIARLKKQEDQRLLTEEERFLAFISADNEFEEWKAGRQNEQVEAPRILLKKPDFPVKPSPAEEWEWIRMEEPWDWSYQPWQPRNVLPSLTPLNKEQRYRPKRKKKARYGSFHQPNGRRLSRRHRRFVKCKH